MAADTNRGKIAGQICKLSVSYLLKTFLVALGVTLFIAGCSKNPSPRSAATELEKVFQVKARQTGATTSTSQTPAPAAEEDQIKETVNRAVTAIRTNGYAEAFFTLRSIQAAPSLTLQQ